MINKELDSWLRETFRRSNLPKYLKYMEGWISNLTEGQIQGFEKMMRQDKEGTMRM